MVGLQVSLCVWSMFSKGFVGSNPFFLLFLAHDVIFALTCAPAMMSSHIVLPLLEDQMHRVA